MILKLQNLIILLFFIVITIPRVHTQELIEYVPQKSISTIMVDLKQINSKANIAELLKLPIFEKLNLEIGKEFFKNEEKEDSIKVLDYKKMGISLNDKAWFYVNASETVFYGALILALENETTFLEFMDKAKKADENLEIKNAGNYKYFNKGMINAVWNSKALILYGAMINPIYKDSIRNTFSDYTDYNYYNEDEYVADTTASVNEDISGFEDTNKDNSDEVSEDNNSDEENGVEIADSSENNENGESTDSISAYEYYQDYKDPYYENLDKINTKCDSIVNFWCETNASIFIEPKGMKSVGQNTEFMQYMKSNPDALIMFDYEQLLNIQNNSTATTLIGGMYAPFTMSNPVLDKYYKGSSFYSTIKHNKDEVLFNIDSKYSELMSEFYKDIKKTKISKKFLKYLSNDLLGYLAVGFDIEGASKGLNKVLDKILPEIPEYGEAAKYGKDVIDIFIDQEAIYNLFTGDMVVSLNGVKPVEVTHYTYDYDENFNATEKLDTTIQMQPEVLCMIGVGDIVNVNKILKFLIGLKALKQDGNIYELSLRSKDLPIYLSIFDNILFISNNKSYIEKPLIYAKDKQLSKEHQDMFNKNTTIIYANTSSIAEHYAKQGNAQEDKILTRLSDVFSKVKFTSVNKDGYSRTSGVLKLSETDDNSLLDIFKFINDLYLIKSAKFD